MTIYGDIVFVVNLLMNIIILFVTGKFIHKKTSKGRLFIAAALGALYVVLSLYFYGLNTLPPRVLLTALLVAIAYPPTSILDFLWSALHFFFISVALGGVVMMMLSFNQSIYGLTGATFWVGTPYVPWWILVLSGVLLLLFTQFCLKKFQRLLKAESFIIPLTIRIGEKEEKLRTFIDSGNLLVEPISKAPVLVAEIDSIQKIIPQSIIDIVKKVKNSNDLNDLIEGGLSTRFRLIPYDSLGNENSLMIGIKADEVRFVKGLQSRQLEDIVIGLYDGYLSTDDHYNGLLGMVNGL